MRTLTEVEYAVLNFVYWNPDSVAEDFMADWPSKLFRFGQERQLAAAASLVERGLLVRGLDDEGRTTWSSTELAMEYLDVD